MMLTQMFKEKLKKITKSELKVFISVTEEIMFVCNFCTPFFKFDFWSIF